ncbi:hypothetical protein H072_5085 [Dactylellina haptotyla CBS 200.50]|uniref:Uncharacterized protein n=1 Tax=Dactylellina haptotyla (strain CBS 200.50) TaxID=1284197 RepID=S8AIQ2_DACHA|nr:hypothetical protein H072_5085 [Dactylellina haptotyla CBS 200.50]
MSSSSGYGRESRTSRPHHHSKYSHDSFDSNPESSDSSSSESSDHYRSHKPKKERSSSATRQYASDKLNGLTKPTRKEAIKRSKAVSDSERRRKSHSRMYYDDSDSSDYDSYDDDSSDDSSGDRSKTNSHMNLGSSNYRKRPKTRLEKMVDEVLDAFGLLHIKNDPSQRQLASPDPEKYAHQKQALQAAVTAAAIEAWRSHSKPGGFNLQKVIRVLVAAMAAGGVDILIESRPGHDRMRDIAEAVVGGLATSKSLGGKITHRREGGAQGKMIDGFIALAASKMVKPPKPDEVERRKKNMAKRSRSLEPSKHSNSSRRR